LVVTPANFNSPNQIVVAGDATAVEIACNRLREMGAKKTIPLAVSAPFHCSLMEPAAEKLEPELARLHFRDPAPPVITNVEAEPNTSAARISGLLRKQVTAPVRFTDMVAKMKALGVDQFLEVGPGRVLSGLIARIERRARRANFSSLADLEGVRDFVAKSSIENEDAN
jgi:[acyl-carrier-protein] S-malonyltransferase